MFKKNLNKTSLLPLSFGVITSIVSIITLISIVDSPDENFPYGRLPLYLTIGLFAFFSIVMIGIGINNIIKKRKLKVDSTSFEAKPIENNPFDNSNFGYQNVNPSYYALVGFIFTIAFFAFGFLIVYLAAMDLNIPILIMGITFILISIGFAVFTIKNLLIK